MAGRQPGRPLSRRQLFAISRGSESAQDGHWIRVHRRAMACRFEVTLSDEDARHVPAARAALDEVDRIEDVLTVFRDTSEVAEVNRSAAAGPVGVSPMLFALLERCRSVHAATGGAFDPTSTPLSRAWGFLAREGRLPSAEEIAAARAGVGFDKVEIDADRRTVRFLAPGVGLNFGAIGKGYALDLVAAGLRAAGVPKALLSAGGSSVLAFGKGHGFAVDVRSPRRTDVLAHLTMREGGLGTSGAGEQFFEVEGRRYGHVIDPRTGWPAEGVLSASVVAPSAAEADALSTAFLVAGPELAAGYCAARAGVMALLVPESDVAAVLTFGTSEGAEVETL
jgi:thiamine biosynthesis lipoprotein